MAILKCKMCGGDVEVAADKTFGTCEYCGCTMTFPKVDDDTRAAAFNRGNHFRRIGEFDKALAVYERIVREDDTDAEAHWCCALCRFGIEYVEDPATMEWLPTCHRASFDSFLEDVDYRAALQYSVGITQRQYQKDAAKIAEVQRGILATSQNAEPYDVFICYKETDEQGRRTKDSMLAQDIYYQLVEQGRRVFFSRITLEDVAGTQYEPYIFAALNSARVMIVVGTTTENLSAVWVKNEWSRFLSLMKKDHSKLLLPCYRDMDPYDLPEQLSVLQSYDMAKIGFIQDLIRGVAKVLDAQVIHATPTVVKETVVTESVAQAAPLLKRAFMFLEDGDWQKADEFSEQVLNIDPECADAYLAKLMVELHIRTREGLKDCAMSFAQYNNYQKAIRFGDDTFQAEMQGYLTHIKERNLAKAYAAAVDAINAATHESQCAQAAQMFAALGQYRDAAEKVEQCNEKSREIIYARAIKMAKNDNDIQLLQKAAKLFWQLGDYKDAEKHLEECDRRVEELQENEAADKRRFKRGVTIWLITFLAAAVLIYMLAAVIVPGVRSRRLQPVRESIAPYQQLISGSDFLVAGVAPDGTLLYALRLGYAGPISDAEYQEMQTWTDVKTVAVGDNHLAVLSNDGTVKLVGDVDAEKWQAENWSDIVDIDVGRYHTVGLTANGEVVSIGWNENGECNTELWNDIVAIAAGDYHTVALKENGRVSATGSNEYGQLAVSDWKNIVAIAAGMNHTVGLCKDGTVLTVGGDVYDYGLQKAGSWKDIVAIAAGDNHTVGLKADGTVVAVGYNSYDQCDVEEWEDIVAIAAGPDYTIGLTKDGRVLCTNGGFDTENWDLID